MCREVHRTYLITTTQVKKWKLPLLAPSAPRHYTRLPPPKAITPNFFFFTIDFCNKHFFFPLVLPPMEIPT